MLCLRPITALRRRLWKEVAVHLGAMIGTPVHTCEPVPNSANPCHIALQSPASPCFANSHRLAAKADMHSPDCSASWRPKPSPSRVLLASFPRNTLSLICSRPVMNQGERVTMFNDMCILVPAVLANTSIEWLHSDVKTARCVPQRRQCGSRRPFVQ